MIIKKLLAAGALSAGLVASVAGVAAASASHPAFAARPAAASQYAKASGTSQAKESEPGGEATSPETDGPGGHQDANGQNVDHQFNGVE
jgi:hypothetical protein